MLVLIRYYYDRTLPLVGLCFLGSGKPRALMAFCNTYRCKALAMKMARLLNYSYLVFYSVMLALYIYLGVRAVAICRQLRLQPEILRPPYDPHIRPGQDIAAVSVCSELEALGLVR